MRRIRAVLFAVTCLTSWTLGCSETKPRTQVVVSVDAESGVRSRSASLRVEVKGGTSRESLSQRQEKSFSVGPDGKVWPVVFSLAPEGNDASRLYEVTATALDKNKKPVSMVRAISGYVEGKVILLKLSLEDACIGVSLSCAESKTCDNGKCGDAWIDPTKLPEYAPGAAGNKDGGVDAAALCRSDDDCDDGNRYPGNVEVCDFGGHDEDCDSTTFGDKDSDGDGEIDSRCCNTTTDDKKNCGTDCDDSRIDVRSGQVEICDGIDNDCDGETDEERNVVNWYKDQDGDGFGGKTVVKKSCEVVAGASLLNTDCNDHDAAIHPGQLEICDGIDNDCDNKTDELPECSAGYSCGKGGEKQACVCAGYVLGVRICGSDGAWTECDCGADAGAAGGTGGAGGSGGSGGAGGSGGTGGAGGYILRYSSVSQGSSGVCENASYKLRYVLGWSSSATAEGGDYVLQQEPLKVKQVEEDEGNIGVTQGFFSVEVGDLSGIGEVLGEYSGLYLEIRVAGVKLAPRAHIGSVPYSFIASDAVGDIHPNTITVGGNLVIDNAGKWAGDTSNFPGVRSVTASAPLTGGTITNSGSIGITKADSNTDGYLSKTDFGAFSRPSRTA